MTTGQRTVTTLLAVVTVMLGLNLIVRGSPTAVAAPPVPEPTVVAGAISPTSASNTDLVWRFWSDGQVDLSRINRQGTCNPVNICGPPIVVTPGI